MHPSPLMRAVDVGLSLCQYNLMFIRPIRRFRAHGQLEARGHTACRTHDPVPAVTLIELRTLAGTVLRAVAIEHDHRLSDSLLAICRHFPDRQHTGEFRARISPAVHQIAPSVVIPKGCRIDIALALDHADRLFPLTGRILGLHHIDTIVRVTPIDIVFAVVVAYRGRPDTIAVLWRREVLFQLGITRIERLQGMTHNLPVHQIPGVQDGQSGDTVKRRGRHIVILTAGTHADIRIGIIRVDHGIGIGAVAIVGRPHFRSVLRMRQQG